MPADAAKAALERCAERDVEQSVRDVCAAPAAAPGAAKRGGTTDVYAYEDDGVTLIRNRLVALRMADGTAFLGYTDANGHIRLGYAPEGAMRLENPALQPLEPR